MSPGLEPEELLRDHKLYDQYVDVVSAFQWLFTETRSMPETVSHFERFPSIDTRDGNGATPDFSVLFRDGRGLVAEIARIALHENSVDSLCRQIQRYDSLTVLPNSDGGLSPASSVDVLLLVPLDIGTDVVRRVLHERLANKDHYYKPQHPPCIVQFVAQPDKYVFQRRSDNGNGILRDAGRKEALGVWLAKGDFKPPAQGFARVKARRPFMNDPVAPLYLASQLWTKVFPTLASDVAPVGDYRPIVRSAEQLAAEIQQRYGRVGSSAVRRAMEILVAARCAEVRGHDTWRIAWGDLAHRGGEDVSEVLARRTARPPARGPIRRLFEAYEDLGVEDPEARQSVEPGRLF